MGEVHDLILTHGVEHARRLAQTKHERSCVDAGFNVLSDDRFELNSLHSGFAITALPHSKVDALVWERCGGGGKGEIKLLVESGYDIDKKPTGLPFGAIGRLLIIYLCTEAKRNNSRFVDLGANVTQFMLRMGISEGGTSVARVRDQTRRISMCRLTFFQKRENDTLISKGSFVRNAVMCDETGAFNPQSWNDKVELDEMFFNELQKHGLPLRESAVRQLSGRSMALDFLTFFSYRLYVLEKPTRITWQSLYTQFGAGFKERWVFVQSARNPIELALAAYPEAKVEMDERGLILHPSPSPVPKVHPWSSAARLSA